jgi:D-glycero-alpha-D-manno-heptose-7-phosphate kinase
MSILGSGDVRDFGRLLHEAWLVKRDLSPDVPNPDVDLLYAEARAAGALGGKLLGAGGGGFILFFAPPERQEKIRNRLHRLIYVPFQLEHHGSQIIFCDPREDYSELDRYRRQNHIEPFRELDQAKVREKRLKPHSSTLLRRLLLRDAPHPQGAALRMSRSITSTR